jgi:lipopolysaccharide export system protein LptA
VIFGQTNMNCLKNIIILGFFLQVSSVLMGQQKGRQIQIVNSDTVSVNEEIYPGVQILIGHVILKHDSAYMFCDSALYSAKEQNFKAFGNIHVQSPTEDMQDTVNMWGDSLNYFGLEKVARVRDNVILQKDSMTLYTENLDYNIEDDIGNYFDGGRTVNGEDTLVSTLGYYYANEDEIFFRDSVRVYNPKYTIFCDTLKHHTKKKISYFLGPTNIVSTDTTSSFLYCENGWYDHKKDIAQFNDNALMAHGTSTLKGDSLYYDRKIRVGRAFNNVRAIDSTKNALLLGNYGEYHEVSELSVMTDSAQFIQIQDEDSLYMHADTIMSIKDSLLTKTDTTHFNIIKAFYKVKIFKSDFQAKCDSLIYTLLDSTFEFHRYPVMWSGKNQITANFIKVITENNEITQVQMFKNSLIVSRSDTMRFDQIRGVDMIAYLDSNQLSKINVKKDAAAIYFGWENKKLMGVNKATSVDMDIYFVDNEVDNIIFYKKPEGTLYPPFYLEAEELKFDNFEWNIQHRPKTKEDIFMWIEETRKKSETGKKTIDLNAVSDDKKDKKSLGKGKSKKGKGK